MAEITILNAEVIRLIPGYGATVTENYKTRTGDTGKNYYTVWTKEDLAVGDLLNVKGLLSVKLDEFETNGEMKYKAVANVNNPTVQKVDVTF